MAGQAVFNVIKLLYMVVHYLGEGCFRLQSGEVSLLVDPHNNRLKANVILRTLIPSNLAGFEPTEIVFPGEYEMKGLVIQGHPVTPESTAKFLKTIYLVHWEEMSLVFLGHLSRQPEADILEKIGQPDVLFLPFDSAHFLPAEAAAKIVKQLSPHFVIPSFSKEPAELAKILGRKAEPQEKLVFKRKDLAGERGQVIILSAS